MRGRGGVPLRRVIVEAAERCQIGVGERRRAVSDGNVGHVEAFRMAKVRMSILGSPGPRSRDRYARSRYTLNCEERQRSRFGLFEGPGLPFLQVFVRNAKRCYAFVVPEEELCARDVSSAMSQLRE